MNVVIHFWQLAETKILIKAPKMRNYVLNTEID